MKMAEKFAVLDFFGIVVGMITLLIIGLGFVWVIYGERYFGAAWSGVVLGLGMVIILLSGLIQNDWIAAVVGIWGASLVWGSTELKAQERRAKLGWFPNREKKISFPFAHTRRS